MFCGGFLFKLGLFWWFDCVWFNFLLSALGLFGLIALDFFSCCCGLILLIVLFMVISLLYLY